MLYSSLKKKGVSRTRNPSPISAIGMRIVTSQGAMENNAFFIFDDFTSQLGNKQTLNFCSPFSSLGRCSIDKYGE